MAKKRIAIVGAGVGGLALAARLASRGFSVEVFEKLSRPGGRNNIIEDKGFKFDTGPSFVLMPDFFEEVFSYCGECLKDYLNLVPLDVSYKIFYADGDCLSVYRDSQKTKDELERIEKEGSLAYDKLIKETSRIYKEVKPLLYKCFTSRALLNPHYWGLIKKINALESYWNLAKRYFKSDKLCYAFTFEAMFIGVSPFDAPAFYSVITYADHVQKIYHPIGGMYQIPLALERLAKKFGAEFHYDSEIKEIKKSGNSVILGLEGKGLEFERVAVNADYAYTKSTLLKRRIPGYDYSCSVYLIYLGLKKKFTGLAHHNLFFAKDLKNNLRQIFKEKTTPQDPSFYVHVPTLTDPTLAPAGKDIFYILIPVPNLDRTKENISEREEQLRKIVFDAISSKLGERIEPLIEAEHRFYPQDFITRYNIKYGATFG
ncbi:MAG: phytoene desaturase, partial [Candidatus Omnitrophica bacterium]|nr:phytoene desaturase [Candidatus Omnitrophota bacterium]